MTIISIISAKGGVGKTTLTANLGVILSEEFKKNVLAIDGNITTPTLGLQLGILSQEKTLIDVLNNGLPINQAIYVHRCGLHVLPASLAIHQEYGSIEKLKEKLAEVKDKYDIILIDGAAGIGSDVTSVVKASDSVLIVLNPEIASVTTAIKAIKVSKALDVPVMGIVINRADKKGYQLKTSEVEELTDAKVIGVIPYDSGIPEGSRHMMPVALYKNNSASKEAFKQLAGRLINEPVHESFLGRLKKIFRGA